MPLKDLQIRNHCPTDKVCQYADEKTLYLEVHPNGSKLWHYKYRYIGKQNRMAIRRAFRRFRQLPFVHMSDCGDEVGPIAA